MSSKFTKDEFVDFQIFLNKYEYLAGDFVDGTVLIKV